MSKPQTDHSDALGRVTIPDDSGDYDPQEQDRRHRLLDQSHDAGTHTPDPDRPIFIATEGGTIRVWASTGEPLTADEIEGLEFDFGLRNLGDLGLWVANILDAGTNLGDAGRVALHVRHAAWLREVTWLGADAIIALDAINADDAVAKIRAAFGDAATIDDLALGFAR